MRLEISAVLFDLDNTLFDHEGSARSGLAAFLRHLGSEQTDELARAWFEIEQACYDRFLSRELSFQEQRRERLRQVLPLAGFPVPTTDSGLDEMFTEYVQSYEGAWRAFPDAVPALRRLREIGMIIGIITNGNHHQQTGKISRIGVDRLVHRIYSSELMGHAKPAPEAFPVPCQEMQLSPGRTLYVGDNFRVDVDGARNAGLRAVHLDREKPAGPRTVRSLADLVPLLEGGPHLAC